MLILERFAKKESLSKPTSHNRNQHLTTRRLCPYGHIDVFTANKPHTTRSTQQRLFIGQISESAQTRRAVTRSGAPGRSGARAQTAGRQTRSPKY
ncbi:hypothetical protein EVAR_83227_1 [Eumeta japonica]|uniref:Uncharacterized protein n=1 Tax=Eumeta variegata TaxID=151549 RepID=A0A4C1Y5S9_EUMVA|nr:hypothetical protein EVAR_83227_1 [Eumeta japonica]